MQNSGKPGDGNMVPEASCGPRRRKTFGDFLKADQQEYCSRCSNTAEAVLPQGFDTGIAGGESPLTFLTPMWGPSLSPLSKSPWSCHMQTESGYSSTGLVGSLVREEGHIYSLAASGDLLYTGSDSKNIRVWKKQEEFSGFKSSSGLVKAIILVGGRILTGHQDGKIRVWRVTGGDSSVHKRVGTLPSFRDVLKTSLNPNNYVEVKRRRNAIWIRHVDAISSLSLSEDGSLLYSGSWDKTFKVWRMSDAKCLESISAHDDAVNSVVAGFNGLVFTGSADGSVKVWRRETIGKITRHSFEQTLLKQDSAITALAVNSSATALYSGSSDGLVNFWERDKVLSLGGALRGHKLAVLCVATAGNLVFSGSADTKICVWRKEGDSHICLSVLSGHSGPVKCLAVEQESSSASGVHGGPVSLVVAQEQGENDKHYVVYSGSLDKSVNIWRVSASTAVTMQVPPRTPSLQQLQRLEHPSPQCFSSPGGGRVRR